MIRHRGRGLAMAERGNREKRPQLWFFRLRRWLFSRSAHLILAVTLFGFLVLWVNLNVTTSVHENPSMRTIKQNIYSRMFEDVILTEPSIADIEKKRRMAIFTRILQKQSRKRWRAGHNQTRCIHPMLNLKHDANQFAYFQLSPLNCTGSGLFFPHKGSLVLNESFISSPSKLGKCMFFQIERLSDNAFSYSSVDVVEAPPFQMNITSDFVRIICALKSTLEEVEKLDKEGQSLDSNIDEQFEQRDIDDYKQLRRKLLSEDEPNVLVGDNGFKSTDFENYDGWPSDAYAREDFIDPEMAPNDYDQFFVQVHPKPEVFQRIAKIRAASPSQGPMKLNVLMFALDSMSHLCYQRKLPETYRFLKEELGAAIFENYNIVGDATTAAIIPMLTGQTEMDLPEVRLSKMEGGMVDEYPLVWKEFVKQGYATLFAEDEPSLSTFNLRLNGFQDAPTDHYMRPFWQAVWESSLQGSSQRFCAGTIPHHHYSLQYLEDFFLKYSNVSRFAFGFHGELTHSDNNPAQYIDADLVGFLKRLGRAKLLEDTVVIVFGDHGARYSKVRYTVQGKLEERLPLMSFVFPEKFRKQYPHLYQTVLTNTQRLTSPFDIHETLLDIADLSRTERPVSNERGISLLREIPAERTCSQAGISMHWCSCLHQVNVNPSEEFVKPAAMALMWHLNAQTAPHRNHCVPLELKEVHSVHMLIPNEKVLRYRKSKDDDQREANFSQEVDIDVTHYQLQVETQPCGAIYEATVMADFRNYSNYDFRVTPGISRINKYGTQPKCVQDNYPMLRKFCCCRDYLTNQREKTGVKVLIN